ncbi:MAG: squalene/phytoene synthase family protein [Gammaproteobacteria bacterium]|nr:squalene/phytoene synthase family protein [Gammaproteobacteria bacterium]MDE2264204.1 squalene/phytoene synthase family protein [Gammaproteobacteria bacterium]
MTEKPEAHTPRFLAWLYSTRLQQPLLASLCAIEREIRASVQPGLDHHVAHTRLEWWREECARCAAGNPVHPLTRELRMHLEQLTPGIRANSVLAGLSGLVDTATWDLAGATFERRAELTAYCRRWAAAMVAPVSWDTGTRDGGSQGGAAVDWSDFGAALCELELLGRLAREARSGRLRIPLDELERAAVAPQALAAPPWPQELVRLLQERHQALRRQLAAAVAGLPPQAQQSARGLLVWAALAWQASLRAERALPHAPAASLAGAAAANWRAWRAARAASSGTLRL